MVLLSLSMFLVACGASDKSVDEVDKVESRSYVSELGQIRFNKDGAMKRSQEPRASVAIDIFFDAACGSCTEYDDMTQDAIKGLLDSGDAEVVYHPVAFLNDKTPDDYSNRAGAYILAAAEYAPDKALSLIHAIMSKEFISDSPGTTLTPDSKFTSEMEKLEFTEEEIDRIESNKEGFVSKLLAATKDFTAEDSEWVKLSSYTDDNDEPFVYTPFVLVNKVGENDSKSLQVESMAKLSQDLLDSVNEAKKSE